MPIPPGGGGGAGGVGGGASSSRGGRGGAWGTGHNTLALGGAAGASLRAAARARALVKRRPGLAKVAATAVGFAGGDVLTQRFNRRLADGSERAHDFAKTAAMLVVGAGLAGPAGLLLFRCADAAFGGAAAGAGLATGKFVADQVVGCAIWQVAYCAICPWYRDIVAGALQTAAPWASPASERRPRRGAPAGVAAASAAAAAY